MIKQPDEHQGLLVVWGQQGMFLPLPNDQRSLNELSRDLGARTDEKVHYSFTGDMLAWPTRPLHLLDAVPPGDGTRTPVDGEPL